MTINDFLVIQAVELPVKDFLNRIETALRENGIKIFTRINHAQAADDVGLSLPDEEVLVFGSPNVGTALMEENPAIGIELPLKILAWRNDDNKTMVAYHNLEKLGEIFQIKASLKTIAKLKEFMGNLINFK